MKNHIDITNKTKCCGCRACEQKCPNKCITMIEDNEGFFYPYVNEEKCIKCEVCIKHCPQLNNTIFDNQLKNPEVYAAKIKKENILMKSSSGGMFSAIAERVIDKGGVVFGCAFDENLIAQHIAVQNKDDLKLLRGSKYVASNLNNTYIQARNYLESGKIVFYTGLPCHIAGLKGFLGKTYDNLITADLICHGTPSQKLFSKYIKWIEKKYSKKAFSKVNNNLEDANVYSYDFRNKETKGWRCGNNKIVFGNARKTIVIRPISLIDPYFSSFLTSKTYRPSCYSCKYACETREGDFTFADYWGIELFHPEFYSPKGVSLLLINTQKGKSFFKEFKDDIDYILSDIKYAIQRNGHLNKPAERPKIRDIIYDEIDTLNFEEYAKKYLYPNGKLGLWIKYMLPENIKIKIKQILYKVRN
ncbi:Periplasmic [Fe] hydrogenase large subunit [Clostridium sp. N3C]|uniref:Coenzyme F420 hydrogenase/dehydrogenase, beta subunit C-terminal domain n=1 Tax=Clostridium sp. N3C TaxID=1776758 RepID=UPI00092DEF49|nr:Coenzyme F420 hydrogenase/dehydrogenase, beta subunit C-terminal domain [Clostridium sp. N3C]SCN26551.1 Periplasmic [Fe] hydrogenase large subunit [Clostridium sp. N3C]